MHSMRAERSPDIFNELSRRRTRRLLRTIVRRSLLLGGLIETITLAQLKELASGAQSMQVPAGNSLELTADCVYEILSGYVAVFDRAAKPRSLLAWRGPGELLGDFYFTNPQAAGQTHDHFYVTDTCHLLRYEAGMLRSLAEFHNVILWRITRQLARKAINSRIRAQIRSHKGARQQIALLFVELIKERGLTENKKKKCLTLNGTFTYYDFMDFLGCSHSTVSKQCEHLLNVRCIEHSDGNQNSHKYEILNIDKLCEIAGVTWVREEGAL